jgi:hypothetical protein
MICSVNVAHLHGESWICDEARVVHDFSFVHVEFKDEEGKFKNVMDATTKEVERKAVLQNESRKNIKKWLHIVNVILMWCHLFLHYPNVLA